MPRPSSVIGLLALASCAAAPPEPPPEAPPIAPTVTVSTPGGTWQPAPPSACESVGREQRVVLRDFIDELVRFAPDASGRELVEGWCTTDPRGTWGLSISEVVVTPGYMQLIPMPYPQRASFTAAIRLMRIDASGRRIVAGEGWKKAPGALADAMDADGEAEPRVLVKESDSMGASTLWTLRGGVVVRHPSTTEFGIREMEDVDGDGRKDLLFMDPFNQQWDDMPALIPLLVAHALRDGTFSRNDKVAVAHATAQCAEVPRSLTKEAVYPATADYVRCARLRGVPPKTVLAQIAAHCGKKDACFEVAGLRAWANVTPPLTIP